MNAVSILAFLVWNNIQSFSPDLYLSSCEPAITNTLLSLTHLRNIEHLAYYLTMSSHRIWSVSFLKYDVKLNRIYCSIINLMISQIGKAPFRGQYKQFVISLRMSSEDTLSIAVESTQTLERYNLSIGREYILQQDIFFQANFEGAQDVYDYLKISFNEIVVEGDTLFFNYEHGKNRVRRISIQLLREAMDPIEFAHLKADKMKEHFTALLLQKDSEIQELKQKYQDMAQRHSAEILQLKGELQQKYEDMNLRYSAEIQGFRGELQLEKAKNRDNTGRLDALAPLIPIVQDFNKMAKLFQKMDHHPNNAHKVYYTLTNLTGTSARIIRTGDNRYYNFINKCEVFPNQKAKYSLTINKTTSNDIFIGFCTEKGMGNIDNYSYAESVYYRCYSAGYLYQGGTFKRVDVGTVAGETVECMADMASFSLSWWKKGSRIAECVFPAGMKNKPIYISIILSNNGDEVDLCV